MKVVCIVKDIEHLTPDKIYEVFEARHEDSVEYVTIVEIMDDSGRRRWYDGRIFIRYDVWRNERIDKILEE